MKSFLLFVAGLILGGIATFILASGVLTGIGAGVGIATGLQAGACLTVEAAKAKGLITDEQVAEIFAAAAQQFESASAADVAAFGGSSEECAKVVADLKAAAQEAQ